MNSRPASSLSADSGNGTIIKHFIICKICESDHLDGSQSLFRVFTHISPLGVATLGWNILVKKKPFGGLLGKSPSMINLQRKTPPWKGVSSIRKFNQNSRNKLNLIFI